MDVTGIITVGATVLVTLAVGLVAHELAHATVLRAFGIPVDLEWRPGHDPASPLVGRLATPLATVTPRWIPPQVPPWGLRAAAMAPLALVTPGVLILAGILPDPMVSGDRLLAVSTIAWLGCALPSPQDFSLFWHAEQVIRDGWPTGRAGR